MERVQNSNTVLIMDKIMEKSSPLFAVDLWNLGPQRGSTKNNNIFWKPLLHPTNEYGLGSLNLHATTFKKTMKITDLLTPGYTSMK